MKNGNVEQKTLSVKVKQYMDWTILVLRKSGENSINLTKRNTHTLHLRTLMSNELKMVAKELKSYLILPPDGPSCE